MMKIRKIVTGILLTAIAVGACGCNQEKNYQDEIRAAWSKTNSYDSANYTYSNSYTNTEGVTAKKIVQGAYNTAEETWSQISAYGTQGIGKMEEVFSPDGVYVRYSLDGETWEKWGSIEAEVPEYAAYLKDVFAMEVSFDNFSSIIKEEVDEETVYTLTYKDSYMEAQVNEDLEAAEAYVEVLDSSGASEKEVETAQERVDSFKMMAGAQGQVIYYMDMEGNLTGIESKMLMENGAGTGSVLRLEEFGQISFEGYTQNP